MTRSILADLAFSARALVKRPGFGLLAVLTVALGIGMNTTMFTVVHDVLWKPLPYPDSGRLVMLSESSPSGMLNCSMPNAADWKRGAASFEDIAILRGFPSVTLRLPEGAEIVPAGFVSPNFFSVMKVQPVAGRLFTTAEDAPGVEPAGVISTRAWEKYFGRDPSIIGRRVRVHVAFGGTSADSIVIAGVVPFELSLYGRDLWLPLNRFSGPIDPMRGNHWFFAVGRLKREATLERGNAELDGVSRDLERQYPETNTKVRAEARALIEAYTGEVQAPLLLLMGAVSFVLLIACGNVAHLLLTRTLGRGREIAVRLALGASRGRLLQLLFSESFLIAVTGGALGVLFAYWGVQWALAYQPGVLPRSRSVQLDHPALLYAVAVTTFTFVVLGLVPVWRASRADVVEDIRSSGRTGTDRKRQRLGWLMIAGELAMAAELLGGAGLMIETLRNLGKVNLGYQPEGMMAVDIDVPQFKFQKDEQLVPLAQRIEQEARSLPGFVSAAFASPFTPGGNGMTPPVEAPRLTNSATPPMVPTTVVSREFFDTMKIPLLRGRRFSPPFSGIKEIIVNEEFARVFFPGMDPVGKTIDQGDLREIVGVVQNTRLQGPLPKTMPEVYWSGDGAWGSPTLLIRVAGRPESVAAGLREKLKQIDPDMRIGKIELLADTEAQRTGVQRFTRGVLLVFAGLAVLLASLGIYGVASYSVVQRTKEIGVRMALGASRENVARLVLGQTFLATIVGALAGAAGGVTLARYLGSQLYGIQRQQPVVYLAVLGVMVAVALLASAMPVLRASRIDPAVCLRDE